MATLSYLTWIVLGMVSTTEVRKKVRRGNGLPSLFPNSRYDFKTDWSARADWISSSVIPSRESIGTTPQEEFKDICLSTRCGVGSEEIGF
jgi:hypothetical protein